MTKWQHRYRSVHNLKEAKAEVRNAKRMKAFELYQAGKTAYYAAKMLKVNKKTVYGGIIRCIAWCYNLCPEQ